MSDPAYLKKLRAFGKGDPTKEDVSRLEVELFDGPDRGAAVVLAALVEQSVEKLLRRHLRETGTEPLFDFGAPLGSFSSKIQMGYAMKLYGADTKRDLDIIRHLRNQFAHSRRPITFETEVVKACCNQLAYPDAPGVLIPFHYLNNVSDERLAQASDREHPRTRYFITCNEIAQRVYLFRGGAADDDRNKLL